jgi:hypothetical protein
MLSQQARAKRKIPDEVRACIGAYRLSWIVARAVGRKLGQLGRDGETTMTTESGSGRDGGSAPGAWSTGTVRWVEAHDNLLGVS